MLLRNAKPSGRHVRERSCFFFGAIHLYIVPLELHGDGRKEVAVLPFLNPDLVVHTCDLCVVFLETR